MPRKARIREKQSIYHIFHRCNEKKELFLSDDDRVRFLQTLKRMKKKYNFILYAYCLMRNHHHLLINDNGNDISKIISSVNVSYASYFNRRYTRCGHLFQDRFGSEMITDERYLLEVSRYIHNNPVKARLVQGPSDYPWSSYSIYAGKTEDSLGLIDTSRVLEYFSNDKNDVVKQYGEFVTAWGADSSSIPDIEEEQGEILDLEQVWAMIKDYIEEKRVTMGELLGISLYRNELMTQVRLSSNLTLKQIGEMFGGLSVAGVNRIINAELAKKKCPRYTKV